MKHRLEAIVALVLVGLVLVPDLRAATGSSEQILAATGVKGGLVVHLGCGDGRLTAALRASDGYIVQGLDADVTAARNYIRSLGLYGPVSAEQWSGARVPYIDNLVNLIVADDLGKVPMSEVLRVLAPLGVAYIGGKTTVKPWPEDIDEWTHYLHGPANNAVAHDTVVGPPRHIQWLGGPTWTRNHDKLNSISAGRDGAGPVVLHCRRSHRRELGRAREMVHRGAGWIQRRQAMGEVDAGLGFHQDRFPQRTGASDPAARRVG